MAIPIRTPSFQGRADSQLAAMGAVLPRVQEVSIAGGSPLEAGGATASCLEASYSDSGEVAASPEAVKKDRHRIEVYSAIRQGLNPSPPRHGQHRDDDGQGDQDDDDPLQQLHPSDSGAVGHFSINAVQRVEFPQDAGVPLFQVEPLRSQTIDPG